MGKSAYIGIDNVARKIKKGYVGVGGVARKIKKAYIGIGGVARPFWSGGEPAFYGEITPLSLARSYTATTSIGNYALFGGGYTSSDSDVVDAYDTSLTRTTPTVLYYAGSYLSATSVGDYALFCAFRTTTTLTTVYNKSLTRTITTGLTNKQAYHNAATSVGNYALFGGGTTSVSADYDTVDAYDTSLTKSIPTVLSVGRSYLSATSVGNYALFGGGRNIYNDYYCDTVDAYDTSLTRTTPTVLSVARYEMAATSIGNYALFTGGYNGSSQIIVDAYNASLTRLSQMYMGSTRSGHGATTAGNFAFVTGTVYWTDAYDASLTRTLISTNQYDGLDEAASVGDYALFHRSGGSDKVFAYTAG